ncbi:MAG: hypothetical protein ABSA08_00830 [Acidimicrobiales bacterium]
MELRRVLGQSTETITARDGSRRRLRLTYGLVDDRPQVVGVELWGADPQLVADELAGRDAILDTAERLTAERDAGTLSADEWRDALWRLMKAALCGPWLNNGTDDNGEPIVPAMTAPITAVSIRLPIGRLRDEWTASIRRREALYKRAVGARRAHPDRERFTPEAIEHGERLERVAAHFAAEAEAIRPKDGRRRGRPAYGRAHFAEVARIYSEAIADGDRAPRGRVAVQMNVDKSTAAKWIARCRRLVPPLLPKTSAGRAAGSVSEGRERGEQS